MDRSVLDEVIAAVEPPDATVAQAARERLDAALADERGSLEPLETLAVSLAAMRRRIGPPLERKVVVAFAAGPDCAASLRAAARGDAPVAIAARAAGARMLLVDAGVHRDGSGSDEGELGPGILELRAPEGLGGEAAALHGVQAGIALVLSLASEGVDLLAVGDLAASGRARAAELQRELGATLPPPPLLALARAGAPQHAGIAGLCLAAAAIRVPVVVDGPSGAAGAAVAARLCPASAGYVIAPGGAAAPPMLGTRGDGSGAALALGALEAAARLSRELRPA